MTLTTRIFTGTALAVVAVLAAVLVATDRVASRAADEAIGRALTTTRAQMAAELLARERDLLGAARVFAQGPARGVIAAGNAANALDQASEAVLQIGADWVQFTDTAGVRLARSDDPSAPAEDLSGSALVQAALSGDVGTGAATTEDGGILQAVAVPFLQAGPGTPVVGTLMAARALDDAFARGVAERTGGEVQVVLFSLDENDAPHVQATTVGTPGELDALLGPEAWVPDSTGRVATSELQIGGEHFVGQGEYLRAASGTPLGGFLVLRSREQAYAPFAPLRTSILASGGLGLAAAALLAWALARHVTRPVASLAAAAARAADGDYDAPIPAAGRDEIGGLARAFRELLSALREQRALVEVLRVSDAQRTVPMAGVAPPTGGLAVGQTFAGRYDVKEVLGEGGMGMVYKARDRELDEVVALKTLRPEFAAQDESALERFRSELRLARRIAHRNVVRTHDLGVHDGTYFITMEYADGRPLKEIIRQRGRLPAHAVLTIGKQLCRALEVAHEAGVIHRDIKPQNVVIGSDGILKVMDFGIARLAERADGITRTGMAVGTPGYMAPEQLRGEAVDARADLYAVGCLLYECLTGRLPHQSDSAYSLIVKVLEDTPVPPAALVPDVPAALDAVVMRLLAREAGERPPSAGAVHDLLEQAGRAGTPATLVAVAGAVG